MCGACPAFAEPFPFHTSFCFTDAAANEQAAHCVYSVFVYFAVSGTSGAFQSRTKLASTLLQTVQTHLFPFEELSSPRPCPVPVPWQQVAPLSLRGSSIAQAVPICCVVPAEGLCFSLDLFSIEKLKACCAWNITALGG